MADRVKGFCGRTLIRRAAPFGEDAASVRQSGPVPSAVRRDFAVAVLDRRDLDRFQSRVGPVFRAGRLAAGRHRPHHVCPCAVRLAGLGGLSLAGRVQRPVAGVAPSAGRPCRGGNRACRRRFYRGVPRHRQPVGEADLGRLVGLGRSAYLRLRAVLAVSRAYRAGARLR